MNNYEKKVNSGAKDGYTNSCMWISILDYLQGELKINITLRKLRQNSFYNYYRGKLGNNKEDAKTNARDFDRQNRYNIFDDQNIVMTESINYICKKYDLVIYFLPIASYDKKPIYGYGEESAPHKIYIEYSYRHYELITKWGEIDYDITNFNKERPCEIRSRKLEELNLAEKIIVKKLLEENYNSNKELLVRKLKKIRNSKMKLNNMVEKDENKHLLVNRLIEIKEELDKMNVSTSLLECLKNEIEQRIEKNNVSKNNVSKNNVRF